eukprot:764585-Hanusia_phi.AAC.1
MGARRPDVPLWQGRLYETVLRANVTPPASFPQPSPSSRPGSSLLCPRSGDDDRSGARPVHIAYMLLVGPRDSATSTARQRARLPPSFVLPLTCAPEDLSRRMAELGRERENVFVLPEPLSITWGGFSMVQAQLDMLNFLVHDERVRRRSGQWDVVINLSGQVANS